MAKNTRKGINGRFLWLLLMASILFGTSTMTVFAQQGYPPPQGTPGQGSQSSSYWNVSYLPIVSLQKPPQANRSYYVANLDNMRELGRIRGDQNADLSTPITDLAILFMGEPQSYVGDIYGVLLMDYVTPRYVYNSDVQNGVQEFVRGYLEKSARNPSSTLNIIVAVNTSGLWINQEHGKSWGDMIEYLNLDWLPTQSGYS